MIQSLLLAKEDREKRIALLHRLGLASHKPDGILRKPGEAKRTAFIVAGRASIFRAPVILVFPAKSGCGLPRRASWSGGRERQPGRERHWGVAKR